MTEMLVLGGTGWLGPELVGAALQRAWRVTTLTRGRSPAPHGARGVVGDRTADDGYDAVLDRDWDVVVDTTWQPGMARTAVAALADRTDRWLFVSSTGAYRDLSHPGAVDDRTALVPAYDGDHAEAADYRGAKVACEEHLLDARGEDCLIARAGLLAGPGDISDRYGYWVSRFATAGDGPVLVPEAHEDELQLIDVRDLAQWLVAAAACGLRGVYDVVGPRYHLGELIEVSRRVAGHTGPLVEVPDDFLLAHGVRTESGGPRTMPLWAPEATGYPLVSAGPVLATGLACRPLAETTRDTLCDETARGLDRDRATGLTRAEELELIEASDAVAVAS